jgi:hypothetical protein
MMGCYIRVKKTEKKLITFNVTLTALFSWIDFLAASSSSTLAGSCKYKE